MTLLQKRLSRETTDYLNVDKFSRDRPIIIELEPAEGTLPAQIVFRWKGSRRRYKAPVARLMQWTIQEQVAAERRKLRKTKPHPLTRLLQGLP